MSTAKELNKPYGGYHQIRMDDDSSRLTQVARGTPGGEYLRRFWHPIMLSSELKDLPLAIRVLAEDLVIFRDRSGRLGLLHRACAHRGASLEFGVITDRGIMCCYHGWEFGIDGQILETPSEPPTSRIRQNFCQGAYPVREYGGMIFAYMGPPEVTPEFPIFDTFEHPPGVELIPYSVHYPCNWLQVVENACDPIHNLYLHVIVSGQFSQHFRAEPVLDFPETPNGMLSMATRRVKDFFFSRALEIVMPNIAFIHGNPPADSERFSLAPLGTRWVVPVDDHQCHYIGFVHRNPATDPQGRINREMFGVGRMGLIGQTSDRPYEERQREPGDHDAVASQGIIANRKAEHLGVTDLGIVKFRRMLAREIAAVQEGGAPTMPPRGNPIRSYSHEIYLRIPSNTPIADDRSISEFTKRAVAIIAETDRLPLAERHKAALDRIRQELGVEAVG